MGDACYALGKASEVMQPCRLHLCVAAGQGQETPGCPGMTSHTLMTMVLWGGYVQCHPVHVSELIRVQGNKEVM